MDTTETKAKAKSNPINGECKLVSLTNEQRVRIFIKCNAIRAMRNHKANYQTDGTSVLSHSSERRTDTSHCTNTHGGFPFSIVSTIPFAASVCVRCGSILFDSHSRKKNHHMTVERCERCTKIRRYAASMDYFAIQKSHALN